MAGDGADSASSPASIGFVLSVSEFDRAERNLRRAEPRRWLVFLAFRGPAVLAAALTWYFFPRLFPSASSEATIFVVVVLFAMPFYFGSLLALAKPFWRPIHVEKDNHRLLFTWASVRKEGLLLETEVSYQLFIWSFFGDFGDDGEFLYFYHRPFDAIYIPVKAFEGPDEARAFLNASKRAWELWKSGQNSEEGAAADSSETGPRRVVH